MAKLSYGQAQAVFDTCKARVSASEKALSVAEARNDMDEIVAAQTQLATDRQALAQAEAAMQQAQQAEIQDQAASDKDKSAGAEEKSSFGDKAKTVAGVGALAVGGLAVAGVVATKKLGHDAPKTALESAETQVERGISYALGARPLPHAITEDCGGLHHGRGGPEFGG